MSRTDWFDLLADARFALRSLLRAPLFSLLVVGTLAIGIGTNTAVFSIVDNVLFRPLPYDDPETLYELRMRDDRGRETAYGLPDGALVGLAEAVEAVEELGYYGYGGGTLTDRGRPEEPTSLWIDGDLMRMLGVKPVEGRLFTAEDSGEGVRALMLGEAIWKRRYQADPGIVGGTVDIDETPYTVVGIVPDSFRFPEEGEAIQLFRPWTLSETPGYTWGNSAAVLRVAEGVNDVVLNGQLAAHAAALGAQHEEWGEKSLLAAPHHDAVVSDDRRALMLLWGAVGFVLLLACLNAANLLLARGATRGGDVAVCAALGAPRSRIMRRIVAESVWLAVAGGLLGLLIAQGTLELLARGGWANLPRATEIGIDGRVFAVNLLVALAVGLLYGLFPAWQSSRVDLAATLKEGSARTSESRGGLAVRGALTVAEIAIACALLIGAGLMIRSSLGIYATELGFDPDRTMALTLWADAPSGTERDDTGWIVPFYDEAVARIEAVPGVAGASVVDGIPWQDLFAGGVEYRREAEPGAELATASYRRIDEDYLDQMAVPLLAGRGFVREDDGSAPAVVLVSRALADAHGPLDAIVGERLLLGEGAESVEVVGVVGDMRDRYPTADPVPRVYRPYRQVPRTAMTLVVRTHDDPRELERSIQNAIWSINPTQGIWATRVLEDLLDSRMADRRLYVALLVSFAVVALLLAAAGIYGIVSYSVSRQTHELGIRMALGATRRRIMLGVLARAGRLALIGVALGLGGAIFVGRALQTLLFEVGPADPLTYSGVAAMLVIIALLSSLAPALRATRVPPSICLRAT